MDLGVGGLAAGGFDVLIEQRFALGKIGGGDHGGSENESRAKFQTASHMDIPHFFCS